MKKKNILILTSSYPVPTSDLRNTFGMFIRYFSQELSNYARVTIITQYSIEAETTAEFEGDVRIIRFSWDGKFRDLADLHPINDFFTVFKVLLVGSFQTFKFAYKNDVDYILCCWAVPAGLWALPISLVRKIPFAIWALGSDIWDYGRKPIIRNIISQIIKKSQNVYADGFKLLDAINDISNRRGEFLSTSRKLTPKIIPEIRAIFENGKYNFLFIGRYHKNKGVDILFDAISRMDSALLAKCHFHVYGGGPMEAELREQISRLQIEDNVTFNGYADEKFVYTLLKSCDTLVIPSRIESIPVILSDALQCNTNILVSNVGDMGELVNKYQAGLVFDIFKLDTLIKNLTILATKKAIINDINKQKLFKLFDVKINVKKFIKSIYIN